MFNELTKIVGGHAIRYIQNLDKRNGGLYSKTEGRDEVDKRWQIARVARVFLPPGKEPRLLHLGSLTHVLRLDKFI